MRNEIDTKISAYLRLAELCGTGDESKRKFYMSEVEKLLRGEEKDPVEEYVKKICDKWYESDGIAGLWMLSQSYKDWYWNDPILKDISMCRMGKYFFRELIERNIVVSDDFDFDSEDGWSYDYTKDVNDFLHNTFDIEGGENK